MPAGCRAAIRSCTPAALAAAAGFRAGMAGFAATRPVHGECGGYMVLGAGARGCRRARRTRCWACSGHATSFARRRLHLGYREARLLGAIGRSARRARVVRGHEFHYAVTIEPGSDAPLAALSGRGRARARATAGGRRGRVSGSFFHAIAPA